MIFRRIEPFRRLVWVIHVVRGIAEGVNFQLVEQVARHLGQQPVNNHAAFDGTLRMYYEDHLAVLRVLEGFFDFDVRVADVHCGIAEASLNEALDHIENNACGRIVNTEDWPSECPGKTIDIGLEPVLAHTDAIKEDPALLVVLWLVEMTNVRCRLDPGIWAVYEDVAETIVGKDEPKEVGKERPERQHRDEWSSKNAENEE